MLEVLLLRHGQTEANREGIVQGHGDSPLSSEGVAACYSMAEKIRGFSISKVYCSDMGRAMRTMELIAEKLPSLPGAVYLSELREIDFGRYTGRLKDEITPLILRHKADTGKSYPDGESGDDLARRIERFVNMRLERDKGATILVITHYGVIETILRKFAGYGGKQPVTIGIDDVFHLVFREEGRADVRLL